MDTEFPYHAFISYSHKDEKLARRLQERLERQGVPPTLRRRFPHLPANFDPIFRDRTAMKVDRLSDAIRGGLSSSKYLIVICTENSAKPNTQGKHWVNEEIEYFVSLRPENIHRIIPVMFRQKASVSSGDCTPPALREERHHIKAVDVQKIGMSHAYSEIIAKMTDINPNTVWKIFQDKMVLKASIFAPLTTIATALGGWGYWDYNTPHHTYYVDYIERNTIPEGVCQLTEDQLATRKNYYRFTTHMGRLRKIEYCDAKGNPVEHSSCWDEDRPACIDNFTYSSTMERHPQMTQLSHCNTKGEEYAKLMFSHTCAGEGMTKEAATGTSPVVSSSVRHLAILKNTQAATPTSPSKSQGMAGYRLAYDEDGRVKTITCLNAAGERVLNEEGWAIVDITYTGKGGAISEKLYKNEKGELHNNEQGYAKVSILRDKKGNLLRVEFFDAHATPCQLPFNGISHIEWQYDSSGELREVIYRALNGAVRKREIFHQ